MFLAGSFILRQKFFFKKSMQFQIFDAGKELAARFWIRENLGKIEQRGVWSKREKQ